MNAQDLLIQIEKESYDKTTNCDSNRSSSSAHLKPIPSTHTQNSPKNSNRLVPATREITASPDNTRFIHASGFKFNYTKKQRAMQNLEYEKSMSDLGIEIISRPVSLEIQRDERLDFQLKKRLGVAN